LWVDAYKRGGVDALMPQVRGPVGAPDAGRAAKEQAVVGLRKEHPEYGTRRIRDLLARFETLGVSETQVRDILHEAGLIEARVLTGPREHPPRRFERAEPNQLWQSDIFTFLLRKHERLYLTAFLDDHSRYICSFALAHHQKSGLVMEALGRAIADYGVPREILTDQGRQYTVWRGETEFEEELRKHGIRHVKSRPQHPQTMGKIERFWKTLWDEFLSRTVFADYADCHRRIGLFVSAYNFQRPHQALGGLVPADRFFRMAPQVRAAIEKNIADNALRLAHEQPTRKPFYLVGRLGDRDLSIAASGSGLAVQLGDEHQVISLRKETTDEQTHASRRLEEEAEETPPRASGAAVAAQAAGPGRDGQAPVPSRAERPVRGDAGVGGDRVSPDLEELLLRPGVAGACGDAVGAHAVERGRTRGVAGSAYRGAGSEGEEARAGEAPWRAPADAHAAAAQAWDGEGRVGPAAEDEGCALEDAWAEAFDELGDTEPEPEPRDFDPDEGWRGRVVSWDRKLAGAGAMSYPRPAEDCDGGEEEDLHEGSGGAPGPQGALRDPARGPVGDDDRERWRTGARDVAQPLPVPVEPRHGGHARWPDAEGAGTAGDAGGGGEVTTGERAASAREREAEGQSRQYPSSDRAGGRRLQSPNREGEAGAEHSGEGEDGEDR
jgi:transposase InsO family protein